MKKSLHEITQWHTYVLDLPATCVLYVVRDIYVV